MTSVTVVVNYDDNTKEEKTFEGEIMITYNQGVSFQPSKRNESVMEPVGTGRNVLSIVQGPPDCQKEFIRTVVPVLHKFADQ